MRKPLAPVDPPVDVPCPPRRHTFRRASLVGMRLLGLAMLVPCAYARAEPPPPAAQPPSALADATLGEPIALGTDVSFSGNAAIVTLKTDKPVQASWAPSSGAKAVDLAATNDGTAWHAKLDKLSTNDDGTLVVRVGTVRLALEWSHATVLAQTRSGVQSADGLFEIVLEPGAAPAGARLGVLSRLGGRIDASRVFGTYQLTASQPVTGIGRLKLPPGDWRWNFGTARVFESIGGAAFVEKPSHANPDVRVVSFEAQSGASYALAIEELQ